MSMKSASVILFLSLIWSLDAPWGGCGRWVEVRLSQFDVTQMRGVPWHASIVCMDSVWGTYVYAGDPL